MNVMFHSSGFLLLFLLAEKYWGHYWKEDTEGKKKKWLIEIGGVDVASGYINVLELDGP